MPKSLNFITIGTDQNFTAELEQQLNDARLTAELKAANDTPQLEALLQSSNWDIALYRAGSDMDFDSLKNSLYSSKKDIPIIMLAPDADPHHTITGTQQQASAVVPIDALELLVLVIRRELYHLQNRRRRRQMEFHLQETERFNRELLDYSQNAIAFLNSDYQFLYGNSALLDMLGYKELSELQGQSLEQQLPNAQKDGLENFIADFAKHKVSESRSMDASIQRHDGSQFHSRLKFTHSRFERTLCTQLDIIPTESGADIEGWSDQDLVTGLKNKTYFNHALDQIIENVDDTDSRHLLYISIDNYAQLKSDIGVNTLDNYTRLIADQIRLTMPDETLLARFDVNTFTAVINEADPKNLEKLGSNLCKIIAKTKTTTDKNALSLTVSIGACPIHKDETTQDLIQCARSVSETIQKRGKPGNDFALYKPSATKTDETFSVQKIRDAIKNNHLKLLFQPIISLRGDTSQNYEVLLRLIDSNDNEISPAMFLTMLDHAKVSAEIDQWVIAESIRQLAEEQTKGKRNKLFINITGRSLADSQLLPWIHEQLTKYDVTGDNLVFQFTEADAHRHVKHANLFIQGLANIHAAACIKQYGSTIDSSDTLRHITVDYVKLDGSFVQELVNREKHEAFDKLIEPLREGKTIIAPLVEGTTVMNKLWKSGVQYIQGYYFQAPREKMDYDFFHNN